MSILTNKNFKDGRCWSDIDYLELNLFCFLSSKSGIDKKNE